MEAGEEADYYTYSYTVTTRMIPALRWAAMRAIVLVSLIVRDKVTRQCPQTTTFEEKGERKQIQTEIPLHTKPNASPLGQTGSPAVRRWWLCCLMSSDIG